MKPIISPQQQKFIIVLIAALAGFFGLQAAGEVISIYQIGKFFAITFYVYLFLVFLQMFIFDLHLKHTGTVTALERSFFQALAERFHYLKEKGHWLSFQNYLILPGIVYWTTVAHIFLNPFDEVLKQVWICLTALALAVIFWYLKTVFHAHRQASRLSRQTIFIVKLYASFLSFSAVLGITRYFGYKPGWLALAVGEISFLLMYQALFQHHYIGAKMLRFLLATGFCLGMAGYAIYFLWNVNFYSGALVLAALYNTVWGLIQHRYVENNLTREVVYEYLAVLFVILVIVLGTTNFAERI